MKLLFSTLGINCICLGLAFCDSRMHMNRIESSLMPHPFFFVCKLYKFDSLSLYLFLSYRHLSRNNYMTSKDLMAQALVCGRLGCMASYFLRNVTVCV